MKKLILVAMLAAVMLTGCDAGREGAKVEGSIYPQMTHYGKDTDENTYYYVVDDRTGVVYIAFDGIRRAGITVALNPDGTPVTKKQLKAWRNDDE